MSETNKVMSSLQFPNTDQPYQVNDARIPTDPGAYKYMATDDNGDWVPADRLAWKTVEEKELFNQTVSFVFDNDWNAAYNTEQVLSSFGMIVIGEKYTVVWDGVEYPDLVAFDAGEGAAAIGALGEEISNDRPFGIVTYKENGNTYISFMTNSNADTHTISITGKTTDVHQVSDEYISFVTPNTPTTILTWDGKYSGLTEVIQQMGYGLYGPFATEYSAKDFVGGYMVWSGTNVQYTFEEKHLLDNGKVLALPYSDGDTSYRVVVVDKNHSFEVTSKMDGTQTQLTEGVWLMYGSGQWVKEVRILLSVVKKDCLPDGVVNDVVIAYSNSTNYNYLELDPEKGATEEQLYQAITAGKAAMVRLDYDLYKTTAICTGKRSTQVNDKDVYMFAGFSVGDGSSAPSVRISKLYYDGSKYRLESVNEYAWPVT